MGGGAATAARAGACCSLAVVPCRGGSKRIPRKNLALADGQPLLQHVLAAAHGCRRFDRVAVATDDAEIAAVARHLGAAVVDVPAALTTDDAPVQPVRLPACPLEASANPLCTASRNVLRPAATL